MKNLFKKKVNPYSMIDAAYVLSKLNKKLSHKNVDIYFVRIALLLGPDFQMFVHYVKKKCHTCCYMIQLINEIIDRKEVQKPLDSDSMQIFVFDCADYCYVCHRGNNEENLLICD